MWQSFLLLFGFLMEGPDKKGEIMQMARLDGAHKHCISSIKDFADPCLWLSLWTTFTAKASVSPALIVRCAPGCNTLNQHEGLECYV